ncbi:MAG: C40 family peptidase [Sporomusaceae bacterium]|nr:C40 family peptidase [Sporomusaceae bacterium]
MLMFKKIAVICMVCSFISTLSYASGIQFREGDHGKDIAEIQVKLKERGYYKNKIDGQFTKEITRAVKKFQKEKKLTSNGIVEEKTYLALVGKPITGNNNSPNGKVKKITDMALGVVGVPYKWGGVSPKGFDCSGLTWYVFDKHAIPLPRTADVQYKTGQAVARGNLQQGDLVFFTTYEPGASHCGIYLGDGKFVHSSSSRGVMVSRLSDSYWNTRYLGARRII